MGWWRSKNPTGSLKQMPGSSLPFACIYIYVYVYVNILNIYNQYLYIYISHLSICIAALVLSEWYEGCNASSSTWFATFVVANQTKKSSKFEEPSRVYTCVLYIPPWKPTWHWKIPIFNRKYIYIDSFMVDFPAIVMWSFLMEGYLLL